MSTERTSPLKDNIYPHGTDHHREFYTPFKVIFCRQLSDSMTPPQAPVILFLR